MNPVLSTRGYSAPHTFVEDGLKSPDSCAIQMLAIIRNASPVNRIVSPLFCAHACYRWANFEKQSDFRDR